MKHLYREPESGHIGLGLLLVIFIALIGVVGYVGYNSWQKQQANAGGTSSVGRQHYFTKKDNERLGGIRVFQLASPPLSDKVEANSPYWPATDFASGMAKIVNSSTWSGGRTWYFQWANRVNYGTAWNRKPNVLPSPAISLGKDEAGNDIQCRPTYTSIARANAATQAQIRYVIGMSPAEYMKPWLSLPGTSENDFVADNTLRASPTSYCTTPFTWDGWQGHTVYKVMTDKVILPALRMTSSPRQAGIVLDYEVQDDRSAATTQAFIHTIAADVHSKGKKLVVVTNPLNAPSMPHTNLTAGNLPSILEDVDFLGITLWSGNREHSISASYDNQIKLLGKMKKGYYKKLILYFELGAPGTTLDDARWVYSKLHATDERHPSSIMFWRNGAIQGEPTATPTNQKTALSLFNTLR